MCYYIGIEDLVANALIERVERTQSRKVSLKQLNEYGRAIVAKLKIANEEAILIFNRDVTNNFFHDCTDYFTINECEDDTIISLNDNVSTDQLRNQFRINISFELLKAFVDKDICEIITTG